MTDTTPTKNDLSLRQGKVRAGTSVSSGRPSRSIRSESAAEPGRFVGHWLTRCCAAPPARKSR
jgi:hypothetical protein